MEGEGGEIWTIEEECGGSRNVEEHGGMKRKYEVGEI